MDNIFKHSPTNDQLESLGITDLNEADYLNRINAEGSPEISILQDLYDFFALTGNEAKAIEIDKKMEKAGAFDGLFNE